MSVPQSDNVEKIKAIIVEVDQAEKIYKTSVFKIIKGKILDILNKYSETIIDALQKNHSTIKDWVNSQIGNIAGDLLESGKYHIKHGVLNKEGLELLKIFDESLDVQLEASTIDLDYAKKQKTIIRNTTNELG